MRKDTIEKVSSIIRNRIEKMPNKSYVSKILKKGKVNIANKEEFDEGCKVLGIETTGKVTFTEIKNSYNVKKEYAGGNSDEKEKINKAFITIRNQYEDYLNNN